MSSQVVTEQLTKDLKTLAHDAENLVKATAGEVGEKAKDARKRLMSALENAKDSARDLQEQAVEKAKVADKVIRNHPYETLGIAFGIGILLGVLLGRGRD